MLNVWKLKFCAVFSVAEKIILHRFLQAANFHKFKNTMIFVKFIPQPFDNHSL